MSLEVTSKKEQIDYFFKNVCKENIKAFKEHLENTSMVKLKEVQRLLSISIKSSKQEAVRAILEEYSKKEKEEMPDKFELKVDETFKGIVPEPTEEQYEFIKESIKKDGLLNKIEVLPDGRILDGHTRYRIFGELGIEITPDHYVVVQVPEEQIERYVLKQNLERRQLSDLERYELVKKYYGQDIQKKVKKEGQEKRTLKTDGTTPSPDKKTTRSEIADTANISESQARNIKFLEDYAPHILETGKASGRAIGDMYNEVNGMMSFLREHLSTNDFKELKKAFKEKKKKVDEEYDTLSKKVEKEREEKGEPAHVPGPMEKMLLLVLKDIEIERSKCFSEFEKWIETTSLQAKQVKQLKKIYSKPFDSLNQRIDKKYQHAVDKSK